MSANRRRMPTTLRLDGDNTHLANLCGPLDENLKQIAIAYGVTVRRRGSHVSVEGERAAEAAKAIAWFHARAVHQALNIDDIQLGLVELGASRSRDEERQQDALPEPPPVGQDDFQLRTSKRDLRPRTPRQRDYLRNILHHDVTFGVGPAGTGKTWLAVACAIDALERESVQRLILTRPAVEA